MKILVTGHLGMIGSVIYEQLKKEHILLGADRDTIDLADYMAVQQLFTQFNPDFVIHCAGQGNVSYCESHHMEAMRDNFQVTRNIASLCGQYDCGLLFCSTDHVYRFKELPWDLREYNETKGASYYGFTKVLAEREILTKVKKHFICRLCWQYGLLRGEIPQDLQRVGMVDMAILAKKTGEPIVIVPDADQHTSNVYDTVDVFKTMIEGKLPYGIYNVSSETDWKVQELYLQIFRRLGLTEEEALKLLKVKEGEEAYHLKPEPFNLKLYGYKMPTTEEGLDRYFRDIYPQVKI